MTLAAERRRRPRQAGFTLIEMLAVLAITAAIAALVFPSFERAMDAAAPVIASACGIATPPSIRLPNSRPNRSASILSTSAPKNGSLRMRASTTRWNAGSRRRYAR